MKPTREKLRGENVCKLRMSEGHRLKTKTISFMHFVMEVKLIERRKWNTSAKLDRFLWKIYRSGKFRETARRIARKKNSNGKNDREIL